MSIDDSNNSDEEVWGKWDPNKYLATYFTSDSLGPDSYNAWNFLIEELRKIDQPIEKALDFGAGPTLFGSIPMAPHAKEIHIADYIQLNMDSIQEWVLSNPDSFDWSDCISEVLKIELGRSPDVKEILDRQLDVRSKITRLQTCNAGLESPLEVPDQYPLIVSTYCVDSATDSKEEWAIYMKNLLSLLDESGTLLLTALRNCRAYKVQNRTFPSANIDEKDLANVLADNNFRKGQYSIEVSDALSCTQEGFNSLLFATIKK